MSESERVLILGTGELAQVLVDAIVRDAPSMFGKVGIVTECGCGQVANWPFPVVGSMTRLREIVMVFRPDLIIVAISPDEHGQPIDQLVDSSVSRHIRVERAEHLYERLTGKLAIEALSPRDLISTEEFDPDAGARFVSRVWSLLLGCIGLVMALPLMGVIAVAIKSTSRGPILFVQERIGFRGEAFKLLKFRTMRPAGDRRSEWVRDNEDRITAVGKVLRKFRLDELPQLINVIRGDMNIVGPRPHPASNFELFMLVSRNMPRCGDQIPYYLLRLRVPPGITGWAQVRYQYANDVDEEIEKLRFDLYYLKHASFWLDLRILFETVFVVLKGKGAAAPESSESKQAEGVESGSGAVPELVDSRMH